MDSDVQNKLLILAPLRGVTVKAFRKAFLKPLLECGFSEAISPFISANPMLKIRSSYLSDIAPISEEGLKLTPQVIGKDPCALKKLLIAFKSAGYKTADLNSGCPYPMVTHKNRGAGLMRTKNTFESMLAAGCEELGDGNFSLKIRLGLKSPRELETLIPVINKYPLRFVTIHARTANQMYEGNCDIQTFEKVASLCSHKVIYNGDLQCPFNNNNEYPAASGYMIGRNFIKYIASRDDSKDLLADYISLCESELHSPSAVTGRIKELLKYWKDIPPYTRLWNSIKICRSPNELRQVLF